MRQRAKQIQEKSKTALSSATEESHLDEILRSKLSASNSSATTDSSSLGDSFEHVQSRSESRTDEQTTSNASFPAHLEKPKVTDHHILAKPQDQSHFTSSMTNGEHQLTNGYGRIPPSPPAFDRFDQPSSTLLNRFEQPPSKLLNRFDEPSTSLPRDDARPSSSPPVDSTWTMVPPQIESPSVVPPRVDPQPPTLAEPQSPALTRDLIDRFPSVHPDERPSSFQRSFETAPLRSIDPSSEAPKIPPSAEPVKTDIKETNQQVEPKDNDTTDEFDPGLSRHIARKTITTIPAKNDRHAGTVCSHENQLLYVDYDETTKRSQVIYLHNIQNPEEKLIMDWVPTINPTDASGEDDWIRDITYCERLRSYILLTQTCLHTWNDVDDRFKEYHVMPGRQLKRVTSDQQFIYLVSASGRMTARGDSIIFLTYDKDETAKAFTDIVPSRMNRGTAPLNGEITDIAVAPRDQIMMTYRLERRSEVGICLFQVGNRGRDWTCIKQLQLNECWHAALTYTPRVEWSRKLNVFVLVEYMTGHLLMIDHNGQIQGECRFTHNDGKSESPINLTISNRDWLCTRYESTIVVKKLE